MRLTIVIGTWTMLSLVLGCNVDREERVARNITVSTPSQKSEPTTSDSNRSAAPSSLMNNAQLAPSPLPAVTPLSDALVSPKAPRKLQYVRRPFAKEQYDTYDHLFYSIAYPKGWKVTDKKPFAAFFMRPVKSRGVKNNFKVNFSIVFAGPATASLQKYAEHNKNQLLQNGNQMKLIETNNIVVNDIPAIEHIYIKDWEALGMTMKIQQIHLIYNGSNYALACMTEEKEYDAFREEIETFISSLTFK